MITLTLRTIKLGETVSDRGNVIQSYGHEFRVGADLKAQTGELAWGLYRKNIRPIVERCHSAAGYYDNSKIYEHKQDGEIALLVDALCFYDTQKHLRPTQLGTDEFGEMAYGFRRRWPSLVRLDARLTWMADRQQSIHERGVDPYASKAFELRHIPAPRFR